MERRSSRLYIYITHFIYCFLSVYGTFVYEIKTSALVSIQHVTSVLLRIRLCVQALMEIEFDVPINISKFIYSR